MIVEGAYRALHQESVRPYDLPGARATLRGMMPGYLRLLLTILIIGLAVWLWNTGRLIATPEVILTWTTESEVETAGFHVYRATAEEGPYERVTRSLIPSSGDPFTRSNYEFRDTGVEPGQTYYYQLEELETTGRFNRLPDIAPSRASREPDWRWLTPLLAALLLVWLLPSPSRSRASKPVTELEA
jgi:hypothetical protein